MEIQYASGDPLQPTVDAVVVPVGSSDDGAVWLATARAADALLDGQLASLANDARFKGSVATTLVVPSLGRLPARRVVLAGIGPREQFDHEAFVRAIGAAVRAARAQGARRVVVATPDPSWGLGAAESIEAAAIGAELALYRFEHYRGTGTPGTARESLIERVDIVSAVADSPDAQRALRRASAIARGVTLARDLGNEPASVLNPESFAARAGAVAESSGLEIEVLGPEELAKLGAQATLAVGGGSATGPRLIRLRYRPAFSAGERVVGLVGKAITFDTGGYSIKPYEGMLEMKGDMSGGAAVLGAMSALRALECPLPVEGTICAAENMISGTAFRPGDVLTGMNGVTMEILSTDAEGRLVLADGLVDTARRGATELIDLATLTGAAVVALGNGTTALFATDDAMADRLLAAAGQEGEGLWRMPLTEALEGKIKGSVADIKNTGGRAGGAITAALFLQHFVEGLPWAHLDIAGAARQDKASAIGPKGSTGVGVRTLLRYLES